MRRLGHCRVGGGGNPNCRPCGEEGRAARGVGFGKGQNLAEDDTVSTCWPIVGFFPNRAVVLYTTAFPKESGGKNKNLQGPRPSRSLSSRGRRTG